MFITLAEKKVKGFKISEELMEKINATIDASGYDDSAWIEQVTNLWVMKEAKVGLPNYQEELSELELHTKRINELVLNMIQRTGHEKEEVLRQKSELHQENEELVQQLERTTQEIKLILAARDEDRNRFEKEKEETARLLHQMEATAENHTLLVKEYKDKNDTLSGLVAEYKAGYDQANTLNTEINHLNAVIRELEAKLEERYNHIKMLEDNYKTEMDRLVEKKDVEKERELLSIKSEYQAKIHSINDEYTTSMKSHYEQIEELRKESESKIKALTERIEQLQNPKNM